MYLSYYNLKVKPFQMSTDPAFLWLGEKHREALAILKYAILENKGVLALTGDVGTGKTTLINALLRSLGEDTVTATIYDPRLEVLDFFNTVAAAFRMGEIFEGKGKFILKFTDFLARAHKLNKSVLLIIDEAQGINEDLLEEIRLLSNLEAGYTRLLNIFFVGQNEFIDILQKYENRALRQRVTIRYHIDPLTLNETAAYIKYRLEVGGSEAPIFDSGAIDEVFIFSEGYPRLINIMCDHALLSGYVREIQVINADLIRECREELLVSKKTSEKTFEYYGDNHRSLLNETMVTEPPGDRFTPVEDFQLQGDDQGMFSSEYPMSEPTRPRKPLKKRFFRSPLIIAFILAIGVASGYIFYSNDKGMAESFVALAKKQAKKYVSAIAGSKNNKPSMAPARPETSDSSSRVEAGKVGDSRFLVTKTPNSTLFKETIPQETETPPVIHSKRSLEEGIAKTFIQKPGGPESAGHNKAMEADTAGASNVSLENSLEKKSPSATFASSDIDKKKPMTIPALKMKQSEIQTLASKPVQFHAKPKTPETIKTKTVKPVEKPETNRSIKKPVQAQKKTSQKYQAEPGVKKKTEPDSPKKPAMEKRSSFASSVSSEKQVITLAAVPLVNKPNNTVVSKTKQPVVRKNEAKEKTPPALPVPDEKKVTPQDDKKVVPLSVPINRSETAGKLTFSQYDLHTRLKAFLNEYCRIYEQKDLDKFSTFFALNAVEKGKPFRFWLSKYRQNFNRIDSIEYDIELERYATYEKTGLVKIEGTFYVRAKLVGSKKWRKNSGQIFMVLEADGNSFKIKQLDY